ncbi:MAG: pyruvate formate lyase family protein [Pseudomonadota bacterium]
MSTAVAEKAATAVRTPKNLSPRITWLRDYYFKGARRRWNNEFTAWTTGTDWDVVYDETSFFIVPETYPFLATFKSSFRQAARPIPLPSDFWSRPLAERRAWFIREVMVEALPKEILPGDLIAGGRFNIQASRCWNETESAARSRRLYGKDGAAAAMKWFHDHGYGNAGATSGHLIPGYQRVLTEGWSGIHADLEARYNALSPADRENPRGVQLRAMMIAATMPRDLARKYAAHCRKLAATETDPARCGELSQMAANLDKVPWAPAETFWEAVQALWLTHMLVLSDENYPGAGVSFGRMDQYLLPYWQRSLAGGMDRDFGKEILKCFWIHANTAYDAMIQTGDQGITAGFGQLITLSGMGAGGRDMTNDLTYAILEVIDDMSPILEPKPNVRLHRNSPGRLLNTVVDMIGTSQGAPFLLNFDERSMAGMMVEARRAGVEDRIHKDNVHEYAPVGCLENTMVGNDRSGTVDCNINLLKAVELAINNGRDLHAFTDPITGKTDPVSQDGPATGSAAVLVTWEDFWRAYTAQTAHIIKKCVALYEMSESIRADYCPTPYLSCLVRGCAEKGLDITRGGPELNFVTMEAVTFATTVDSLLAVRYLVFDQKACTLKELAEALKANWQGHAKLRAMAINKAPKYGRDDDVADAMARQVMDVWTEQVWQYRTLSTDRQFRPGMLSWNYWVGDGFILPASPDGRLKGQFLSNAICPSNGADIHGPTANTNSVGKALGGHAAEGQGDWAGYRNCLPNGASHTITFNPAMLRDGEHKAKFAAFLRGYTENGGTALQINMLDPETLRAAQRHPQDYRHLLVRVTGYNAYFTSIGRELQDEVIARISHNRF